MKMIELNSIRPAPPRLTADGADHAELPATLQPTAQLAGPRRDGAQAAPR